MKKQTTTQLTGFLTACLLTIGSTIQIQATGQATDAANAIAVLAVSADSPSSGMQAMKTSGPDLSDISRHLDAGQNATVCLDEGYYALNGTCTFPGQVYWTTSGDGQFSDPSSLDPVYQPGDYDICTGQVTLSLHLVTFVPEESLVHDSMILTLINCSGETTQINEY